MIYRPTGECRESYLTGIRPSGPFGEYHDVKKRRDNLPDNVFAYVRDGVEREELFRIAAQERRLGSRMMYMSGTSGKKMAGGTTGDEQREFKRMKELDEVQKRHNELKLLYSNEMKMWQAELSDLGLGIHH